MTRDGPAQQQQDDFVSPAAAANDAAYADDFGAEPQQQQAQQQQQQPAAAPAGSSAAAERDWLVADKQQQLYDEMLGMGVKRGELLSLLAELGQSAADDETAVRRWLTAAMYLGGDVYNRACFCYSISAYRTRQIWSCALRLPALLSPCHAVSRRNSLFPVTSYVSHMSLTCHIVTCRRSLLSAPAGCLLRRRFCSWSSSKQQQEAQQKAAQKALLRHPAASWTASQQQTSTK
jgi:hypothetical protein